MIESLAVVATIIIVFFLNKWRRKRAFYKAIENSSWFVIAHSSQVLEEFYTRPSHPKKNEVTLLGINSVLNTETNEEIYEAVKCIMTAFILGTMRNIYKHDEDILKILNNNPKIKEKFQEAVSITSMFARSI